MDNEIFEVQCNDGIKLRGILLRPSSPKAVIQFNCGTGIKKEYYLPFLSFLAEKGYLCCLWDYRGIGESEPSDLKSTLITYSDYGMKDMVTIKNYLESRFSQLPFFIVAHSVGGQQIGFVNNLDNVKGMINFAVSAGYYPNMPFKYRIKAYFFFYVFSPISVFLTGYVKSKSFGFMENLPKNVVKEWRNWLEKEDYFFNEKFYGNTNVNNNFKKIKFPIHIFLTTDDEISTQKNVENYWKNVISQEKISYTIFNPSRIGVKRIGHFGFFKRNMKNLIWADVLNKLEEMVFPYEE